MAEEAKNLNRRKPLSLGRKKPEHSIAVLNYMAIVPFKSKYVAPTRLAHFLPDMLKEIAHTTGSTEKAIYDVCCILRRSFKDVATMYTSELVIDGNSLYDDCRVDIDALIYDTHVLLYMRLPAVVSIHESMHYIRNTLFRLAKTTELAVGLSTYGAILSAQYCVLSCISDPASLSPPLGDAPAFDTIAAAFCSEHNIDPGFLYSLSAERERQLDGRLPLDSHVSVYK